MSEGRTAFSRRLLATGGSGVITSQRGVALREGMHSSGGQVRDRRTPKAGGPAAAVSAIAAGAKSPLTAQARIPAVLRWSATVLPRGAVSGVKVIERDQPLRRWVAATIIRRVIRGGLSESGGAAQVRGGAVRAARRLFSYGQVEGEDANSRVRSPRRLFAVERAASAPFAGGARAVRQRRKGGRFTDAHKMAMAVGILRDGVGGHGRERSAQSLVRISSLLSGASGPVCRSSRRRHWRYRP